MSELRRYWKSTGTSLDREKDLEELVERGERRGGEGRGWERAGERYAHGE